MLKAILVLNASPRFIRPISGLASRASWIPIGNVYSIPTSPAAAR